MVGMVLPNIYVDGVMVDLAFLKTAQSTRRYLLFGHRLCRYFICVEGTDFGNVVRFVF